MPIPLVDLVAQYENIQEEVLLNIQHVLQKGDFILGEEVALFEDKFADFCGTDHCVALSSGTEALHLTLRALALM